MALDDRKALILELLKNGRRTIDEAEAWAAITQVAAAVQRPSERKIDQKRWADECVFRLGLLYAYYTNTLPGFTNCEVETKFERFVRAVIVEDVPIHVSRNLIKAAIRRLDVKHNPQFMHHPGSRKAAE
jgi:hypothetical protein